MEAAVLVPQQANPAQAAAPGAPARKAAAMAAIPRLSAGAAARRKTLCDITNLRRPPAEEQDGSRCAAAAAGACADGVEGVAQLVKENSDLVRLLEERDKIIELSGTELQKMRLANWQLAQANSQMLAELNLGRNRLKALQHELASSRAVLKAKSSELEELKKVMKRSRHLQEKSANEMAQHLASDRAPQIKDGDVVNPEPASDASHAGSIKKPGNASRKRMLRSRSLGPAASTNLAAPKEKESAQRRKSMRTPQPSDHRQDLFEIEDVQLAIGSGKPGLISGNGRNEIPRRSSLGRPLRQAKERVTSYKEMPVNIKLRRS